MLAQVVPDGTGTARRAARRSRAADRRPDRGRRQRLTPGEEVAEVGGRPAYPGAGAEYYERNGADTALDVNELVGGEPRTVLPVTASAVLSVRLAPGQSAAEIAPVFEGLLRGTCAAPGRRVEIDAQLASPRLFDRRRRRSRWPSRRIGVTPLRLAPTAHAHDGSIRRWPSSPRFAASDGGDSCAP